VFGSATSPDTFLALRCPRNNFPYRKNGGALALIQPGLTQGSPYPLLKRWPLMIENFSGGGLLKSPGIITLKIHRSLRVRGGPHFFALTAILSLICSEEYITRRMTDGKEENPDTG
jgi:hypothetical protein